MLLIAPVYDVSSAEIDLDALTKSVTSSFHPFIPRAISSRPHQSLEELADVSNLELELNSTYATDDGGVDELDFKFDALDVSETYDLLLL